MGGYGHFECGVVSADDGSQVNEEGRFAKWDADEPPVDRIECGSDLLDGIVP